jgi:hypothetical protein
MLTTQIGTQLFYNRLAGGFIPAVFLTIFLAGWLYRLMRKNNGNSGKKLGLKGRGQSEECLP